ncbi:DNA-binding protein [Undibacterium sp. KW1]|uniref:DNA-binding protein n=1 Tax=Undibacterium sp. KW1 TaxID=2058624 RepID=UPI00138A38AE|nr:DNA-binding protein [Undibacterium sp. KW1]
MARAGLYKSEVEKARNTLIAQGRHSSVDAVRIVLGNTGSKTTIHKYLKELEAEGGGNSRSKAPVSEALQNLVAQLATQLEAEADNRIAEMAAQCNERDRLHAVEIAELKASNAQTKEKLDLTIAAIKQEIASHEQTREALQTESMAHHTLAQQVIDLRERLAENEIHRQSLEEKHQHARDALEHYRASVKEQRDQDVRRHEQQVQQLQAEQRQLQQNLINKQNEITRLNQDGARWVAEIAQAQKTIYEEQTNYRKLNSQVEALRVIEQRAKLLEPQLNEKDVLIEELKARMIGFSSRESEHQQQQRQIELELNAAKAKINAQEAMMAELKNLIRERMIPGNKEPQTGK